MYTKRPPIHPETVQGVFREDVRLTPAQLASALHVSLPETADLSIQAGADGLIGRPEVAAWRLGA